MRLNIRFTDFDYVLTDNAALNTTLGEFEAATITYSTIDSDGYGKPFVSILSTPVAYSISELNVKEMRPPKMDDSGRTKYPVLFLVWVPGSGSHPHFSDFQQLRWSRESEGRRRVQA